jgi:16S rRNA pseudouridine516 synthase
MEQIRLDRFLAEEGLGSRRDVKETIKAGQVLVNGAVCRQPEQKIHPETDCITFCKKVITYRKYVYFLLNKPKNCITASRDPREKTVLDFISTEKHRNLFPVGRLDKDTEGLLLITDDGELAHRLLSPRSHVEKTYLVTLLHPAKEADAEAFLQGISIGEKKPTLPAKLEILPKNQALVTICEGKYHQIKRMFQARENQVLELKRLSMGAFRLDETLLPGCFRQLTEEELAYVENYKGGTV